MSSIAPFSIASPPSSLAMTMATDPALDSAFLQQDSMDHLLKTHAYSLVEALESMSKPMGSSTHRLNVKTHVFKKELQEYVPTQIEDRLRIETIIYVELSVVDQEGSTVHSFDYARMPKRLFYTQPDKLMNAQELVSKRVIDIGATLHCPSNDWREEKEACARCARRMSTKLNQDENRIIHLLPEIHRTDEGDALISFRNGVANIQFKINCYCGHKKEKEGFVVRFDPQSDNAIASHVTLPLMFYHQNKNRVASKAAAKSLAEQDENQVASPSPSPRNIVKSATSKNKREPRSKPTGNNPLGGQPHPQTLPSPPNSLHNSPLEYSISPQLDDFMDSPDFLFTVPSPPPPDPFISLFPELAADSSQQQQQQSLPLPKSAIISHVTPNSGPNRGGTFVTVHGSDFPVGDMMYVCFGESVVPVIPQRDHMLECYTPASAKTETVSVFAMVNNLVAPEPSAATFTYVDDNEKELIKLALQRMMSISARMEGPLDSVLTRANEFTMWSDLLDGNTDIPSLPSFTNLEQMVLESLRLVDSPLAQNCEGLSIMNKTGHNMLHLSVSLQYEDLARDLIQRGIALDLQDKNGLTALNLSQCLQHESMAELIANMQSSSTSAKDNLLADGPAQQETRDVLPDGKLHICTKDGEGARHFQELQSPEVGRNHTPQEQNCLPNGEGAAARCSVDTNAEASFAFAWETASQSDDDNGLMEAFQGLDDSVHSMINNNSALWESNSTLGCTTLQTHDPEGVLDVLRQREVTDAVSANVLFQRNNDDVGMHSTSSVVDFQRNNDDVVVEAADASATAGQAVVQSSLNVESEPLFQGVPGTVPSPRKTIHCSNASHSSIPSDDDTANSN